MILYGLEERGDLMKNSLIENVVSFVVASAIVLASCFLMGVDLGPIVDAVTIVAFFGVIWEAVDDVVYKWRLYPRTLNWQELVGIALVLLADEAFLFAWACKTRLEMFVSLGVMVAAGVAAFLWFLFPYGVSVKTYEEYDKYGRTKIDAAIKNGNRKKVAAGMARYLRFHCVLDDYAKGSNWSQPFDSEHFRTLHALRIMSWLKFWDHKALRATADSVEAYETRLLDKIVPEIKKEAN